MQEWQLELPVEVKPKVFQSLSFPGIMPCLKRKGWREWLLPKEIFLELRVY